MKPFFTYYGGKYRAALHYPKPLHGTIVEPFAGSAGYSLRYHEARVILVELNPTIAAIWRYVIGATAREFLMLPDLQPGQTVDDLRIPQEARWLIGFWLNKGSSGPCKVPSAWMRGGTRPNSFWGPAIRRRLASQAGKLRHWKILECSYSDPFVSEIGEATWFIDPPYETAGKHYKYAKVDYSHLARWCLALRGQAIVCENEGASWLPFQPFRSIKSNPSSRGKKFSKEVIFTRESEK